MKWVLLKGSCNKKKVPSPVSWVKKKKKKIPACLICFCQKWPENLIINFFWPYLFFFFFTFDWFFFLPFLLQNTLYQKGGKTILIELPPLCFLFPDLRFYGLVNPLGSCWIRSVYLITLFLERLSILSGLPVLVHIFFLQKLMTALFKLVKGRYLQERNLPDLTGMESATWAQKLTMS